MGSSLPRHQTRLDQNSRCGWMRTIGTAAVAFGILCCGYAVEYVPYYVGESQEQRLATMRSAPVIVVGTVKAVKSIGSPKPAPFAASFGMLISSSSPAARSQLSAPRTRVLRGRS